MKTPESLVPVVDRGIITEVVRPLMSGKEAQVYVVIADGVECVAKVYKEASQRTFKHRAEYTEGRRTRNSRDQRAMSKRSRHGRSQDEAGWRSTEVDMIRRLRDAGVRVPGLINFFDGVLVMEFVKDVEGDPAPRLGDLSFSPPEARAIYQQLLREATRMLCAGVVHGDLSEFNVLMGKDGPVVIDFPQSMEAARNQGARKFLLRDVGNLHRFVGRYCPNEPTLAYGEEMWELFESNRLEPDTELRGDYQASTDIADTSEVLALIEDVDREEFERREARGEEPPVSAPTQGRQVADFTSEAKPRSERATQASAEKRANPQPPARGGAAKPAASKATAAAERDSRPKKRRNRRGRKRTNTGSGAQTRESPTRVSQNSRPPKADSTAASGEAMPSKRQGRRGGRSRTRGGSGEANPSAHADAERPARVGRPAAEPRGGSRPQAAPAGTARPARRRRRRRRPAGTSEPN
jgi:RIO kinase 1